MPETVKKFAIFLGLLVAVVFTIYKFLATDFT